MARIKPDRTGYNGASGFKCVGIDIPVIEPIDCQNNQYKKLPMASYGGMQDIPWQNLAAVAVQGGTIREMCDLDYDPFFGFFMDLYGLFQDAGLDYLLADDCYESTDVFGPGFMNPDPKIKYMGPNCPSKQE